GDRAWVTVDTGRVFAGERDGADWSWKVENTDPSTGDLLSVDPSTNRPLALRAIAIDAAGRGFAVGDRGLVLERTAAGVWRRLDTGFADNLTTVTLGPGAGALIGADNGLVLTLDGGQFVVAHAADAYGATAKTVVGMALLPGVSGGQSEAWAALS